MVAGLSNCFNLYKIKLSNGLLFTTSEYICKINVEVLNSVNTPYSDITEFRM